MTREIATKKFNMEELRQGDIITIPQLGKMAYIGYDPMDERYSFGKVHRKIGNGETIDIISMRKEAFSQDKKGAITYDKTKDDREKDERIGEKDFGFKLLRKHLSKLEY